MTAEADIKAVPTATATTTTAAGAEQVTLKKAKTEMAGEKADTPYFKVKKLSEDAILPKRGSAHAAGYDVCRYLFLPFHDS